VVSPGRREHLDAFTLLLLSFSSLLCVGGAGRRARTACAAKATTMATIATPTYRGDWRYRHGHLPADLCRLHALELPRSPGNLGQRVGLIEGTPAAAWPLVVAGGPYGEAGCSAWGPDLQIRRVPGFRRLRDAGVPAAPIMAVMRQVPPVGFTAGNLGSAQGESGTAAERRCDARSAEHLLRAWRRCAAECGSLSAGRILGGTCGVSHVCVVQGRGLSRRSGASAARECLLRR
jgi:hypothetical protein